MCAIFGDLGANLEEQTTTITATAESINAACDTNLTTQNISITGQIAVVTNLVGATYEKKVEVDGMTIFVTNNETGLKIAYGLAETPEPEAAVPTIGDRIIFNLSKTTGDFQLEFIQSEGGFSTLYRAYRKEGKTYILGMTPQGSVAHYFATISENDLKGALDYKFLTDNRARSICLNLINGTQVATYETCFTEPTVGDLNTFTGISGILGYDFVSNISTWANVTQDTTIDFSVPSDLNSTTFSAPTL